MFDGDAGLCNLVHHLYHQQPALQMDTARGGTVVKDSLQDTISSSSG